MLKVQVKSFESRVNSGVFKSSRKNSNFVDSDLQFQENIDFSSHAILEVSAKGGLRTFLAASCMCRHKAESERLPSQTIYWSFGKVFKTSSRQKLAQSSCVTSKLSTLVNTPHQLSPQTGSLSVDENFIEKHFSSLEIVALRSISMDETLSVAFVLKIC